MCAYTRCAGHFASFATWRSDMSSSEGITSRHVECGAGLPAGYLANGALGPERRTLCSVPSDVSSYWCAVRQLRVETVLRALRLKRVSRAYPFGVTMGVHVFRSDLPSPRETSGPAGSALDTSHVHLPTCRAWR
jgi:hypothetical protein